MTKIKILYVDDEAVNLTNFSQTFGNEYFILTSGSGEEALQILEREKDIGIVIVDQRMPAMTGIQFLEKAIRINPEPVRMILTAYIEGEEIIDAINQGQIYNYILKPYDPAALRMTLQRAAEQFLLARENKSLLTELAAKNEALARANDELMFTNTRLEEEIAKLARSEAEVAISEKKSRALFNQAADGILVLHQETDGTLVIEDANDAACTMHAYTRNELIKMPLSVLEPDDETLLSHERIRRLWSGKAVIYETRHRCKDGILVPVEVSAKLVPLDSGGSYIYAISRDITERKQAEREMIQLQTHLQQAQKMEAIGTLAGGIAHDFNNILAAILGFTDLALDETDEGTPLWQSLNEVRKAGNRARDLVRQILTFSRQGEEELIPMQPHLIIKEVLKLLRASLPSTIRINQRLETGRNIILADPTQIHQVLMNLCTNAAHAMDETGGELFVELASVEFSANDLVPKPELSPGAYVRITVRDTGQGMDQATMDRIFDPFFTTKELGKGTGMGLAVAHGIVKKHGGIIRVESSPGMGSSFSIFFSKIEKTAMIDAAATAVPLDRGTERILFVDDEEALTTLAQRQLARLGYAVTTRTSSLEALAAFRANPERFDLVVTDLTMPNMTGIVFAKKLKEIRADIPIILCTGYSTAITDKNIRGLGINGYVMKPVVISELAKVIRTHLDRQTS